MAKEQKKRKSSYKGVRLDSDTEQMVSNVANVEDRTFSNAFIRLARIGYKQWDKHKKNSVACF